MRPRRQYRMLQIAFVFALVGVAFFGSYQGVRHSEKGESRQTASHHGDQKHPPPFSVEWFTADPVAFATFVLVFATTGLFVVTGGLYIATTRLARDAARTASDEFRATHRPRLRVRYFRKIDQGGGRAIVKFSVVNVGDTDGYLTSCVGVVEWLNPKELPAVVTLAMAPAMQAQTFQIGHTEEGSLNIPPDPRVHPYSAFDSKFRMTPVAYGILEYTDRTGASHWRTAFCRYAQGPAGRLIASEDQDYEYED